MPNVLRIHIAKEFFIERIKLDERYEINILLQGGVEITTRYMRVIVWFNRDTHQARIKIEMLPVEPAIMLDNLKIIGHITIIASEWNHNLVKEGI